MNNFYVYKLINPITNMTFYVGKGKRKNEIFTNEKKIVGEIK